MGMRIAVQDANVLIDLELAGLFDSWFRLDIETHTSDLIKEELRKGGHVLALSYFRSGQVREHALSFEELSQISELEREIGSKAKFNDCSVLYLAMKLDAMLISGDKPLRKAGRVRSVEVHGTLWIMDQLVEAGELSRESACGRLRQLLSLKRFLPAKDCEERLKRWGMNLHG